MANSADVFHIIALSNTDVIGGVLHELTGMSFKSLRKMGGLQAKFGALALAEKQGAVVRKMCEVYFLAPFDHGAVVEFAKHFGVDMKNLSDIYFFNAAALATAKEFGVQLPPPVEKITRGEMEQLPSGLGTFLHFDTFSVA